MDASDRLRNLRADIRLLEQLHAVAVERGDAIMAAAVNEIEAERIAELRRLEQNEPLAQRDVGVPPNRERLPARTRAMFRSRFRW
jgi:hypothetical protein